MSKTIDGEGANVETPLINLQNTSNQIVFTHGGKGYPTIIDCKANGSSSPATYSIPDVGTSGDILLTTGTQTISGSKTFTTAPKLPITNTTLVSDSTGTIVSAIPMIMQFPSSQCSQQRWVGTMSATNNIYTVPSGYYATVTGINQCGVSTNFLYASPDAGTTRYLVFNNASVATGTSAAAFTNVFLPGDSIIFTCTGTPQASITWFVWPASLNLIGISSRGTASGTTTVYTCPTGKRASIVSQWPMFQWSFGQCRAACFNGTTTTFAPGIRTNGVSYSYGNTSCTSGTTVLAGTNSQSYMEAGDTLEFTCSVSNPLNHMWCMIYELPVSNFTQMIQQPEQKTKWLSPMIKKKKQKKQEVKEEKDDDFEHL